MLFLLILTLSFTGNDDLIYGHGINTDIYTRESEFPGQVTFQNNVLDTVYGVSSLHCAGMCSSMSACFGYKFHKGENKCQFRSLIHERPKENRETKSTFMSYTKLVSVDGGWSDWTIVERGACSVTCGSGTHDVKWSRECNNPRPSHGGANCHGINEKREERQCNSGRCPESVCGQAPDVPNATKKTTGRSVGNVTTYTCNNPDFILCPVEAGKSVCQSTGQWEHVTGKCEQFRWRNPKTHTKHMVPCQKTQKLRITVKATPVKTTRSSQPRLTWNERQSARKGQKLYRFTLFVMKNKYMLLVVDFRVDYGPSRNKLVITSGINNHYEREVKRELQMKYGKEMTTVITVNRKRYKVNADGRVQVTYKSMKPYPEYLKIERLVTVKFVEIKPDGK